MEDKGVDVKAAEAQRLLNDPLIQEGFELYERALIDRAVYSQDDAERCRLMDAVHVCRMVKKHLQTTVFDGKKAAKAADEIASGERWLQDKRKAPKQTKEK